MGQGKFCLRIDVSVQTPSVQLVGDQAEREVRTEVDTVEPAWPTLEKAGLTQSLLTSTAATGCDPVVAYKINLMGHI